MMPIEDRQDCNKLQRALDHIHEWSITWGLKFNAEKCNVISFNRRRAMITNEYKINGKVLTRVKSLSDLGLIVDERLSWNEHTISISNKANQRLGLVKRTLGYNASKDIKLQCYKSMVQPLLEYRTSIWSNCSRKSIERIENVQRRGTRYILNDYQHLMDYKTRLNRCEFIPLSYRRVYLDLTSLMIVIMEMNCTAIFHFCLEQEPDMT